jgi:hypothetical protein
MSKNISLQDLIVEIQKEFPKFEIIKKEDSFLMKAIDIFLKIITLGKMKTFMSDFITTIGYKVYVPSGWELMDKVTILCHERVHMRQANKYGRLWFSFSYLFLWAPTVFAHFRKKYEQEAYEESLRCIAKTGGIKYIEDKLYRENVIAHFTSAEYFWTWPFRKSIETWYDSTVKKIQNELET